MATEPRKHRSASITAGYAHAPARAMRRATGFGREDIDRPFVGIANTWVAASPYSVHMREVVGDHIVVDVDRGRVDVEVPEDELDLRRATWVAPPPRWRRGVFARYVRAVGSPASGAACSA